MKTRKNGNVKRVNEKALQELLELILTETTALHQLHGGNAQVNFKGVI